MKLSKFPPGMIFLVLILLSITPLSSAFGEETYNFDPNLVLISDPTVCIIESEIEDFSKYKLLAIQSVLEWSRSLKIYTNNADEWNIYHKIIPLDEKDNVTLSDCYILLSIYDISGDGSNGEITWLENGHASINIYNIDELTPLQITSTISHELGHAFGLDHYVTDDEWLLDQWNHGHNIPSIMVEFTTLNNIAQVTELDLEMMVYIYGDSGFHGISDSSILGSLNGDLLPDWIQNIFKWYGEGTIPDQELVNAIQYLVQNGIIQIV